MDAERDAVQHLFIRSRICKTNPVKFNAIHTLQAQLSVVMDSIGKLIQRLHVFQLELIVVQLHRST